MMGHQVQSRRAVLDNYLGDFLSHYMVPVLDAVKAEMRKGGSGKPDYRYRLQTGCGEKRSAAQ